MCVCVCVCVCVCARARARAHVYVCALSRVRACVCAFFDLTMMWTIGEGANAVNRITAKYRLAYAHKICVCRTGKLYNHCKPFIPDFVWLREPLARTRVRSSVCVCEYASACVRACVRACVHVCVRACVRV